MIEIARCWSVPWAFSLSWPEVTRIDLGTHVLADALRRNRGRR